MLLEIKDGTVLQNGIPVLSHFDFWIRGNERAAIVGRNGAGKTTLLEVITGAKELEPNPKNPASGLTKARRFTIGTLRQQAVENPDITVEECILEGALSRYASPKTQEEPGASDAANIQEEPGVSETENIPEENISLLYSKERFDFEQRYDRIFTGFGFALEDRKKRLGDFSGGEQTKIMMIRLLLMQPDVLVLDEPTNHLDLDSIEWLENYLLSYPGAVLMVSHDRFFLDRIAEVVWEVSNGRVVRYAGNYSAYREEKRKNEVKQRRAYEEQQAEIARLNALITKFKNKPRKAAFARSRQKILERMEHIGMPDPDDAVIHTGDILPERLGNKWVFECEDLTIGYDKKKPIRKLSFRLRRGQKIGVLGPNGTGKSTFLKTVAGLLPPLGGKVQIGENVDLAYYDQMTAGISSDQSVAGWFSEQFPFMKPEDVRGYLAGFLFRGEDFLKAVGSLSGGEKARLRLAAILAGKPNFLVLDEPTNNMDIPAKETLESVFRSYKGTILFVSHDRYFLDRVADALLLFEPGRTDVLYYPSDYSHYAERKRKLSENDGYMRTAEEQRLIEELRAVPKAEKGMLRTIPDADLELDWRFELNHRERAAAEQKFAAALSEMENLPVPDTEEEYEKYLETEEKLRQAAEEDRDAWTKTLLDWFDIWQDAQDRRRAE